MKFKVAHFSTAGRAMNYVFVYGTLKKGQPNHHWFKKENGYSKFISAAQTSKKYPLIIASRYNIPFLLYSPGNGENIMGEVYEVDNTMLASLDILEDHPSFYVREIDKVNIIDCGSPLREIDCWIYFLKNFKPELLSQECIKDYDSLGAHGKPYADREQRDPSYHAISDVLNS